MRNKGDEQFYHRHSRKELQCLCKKYGLPANRSSSEMEKSLAFCFKNMNSMASGERLDGTQEALFPTFMIRGPQPGAPFHSLEDGGKDNIALISCPREEVNRGKYSQTVRSNELGVCIGDRTYAKDGLGCSMHCFLETSNSPCLSQCVRSDLNSKVCLKTILCKDCSGIARDDRIEDICSIQHSDVNFFLSPKENVPSSDMKTIRKASPSSFEFYVHSEEGIKLCVDFNSSPSDWIKKLKSEVNISENMCQNNSPSFHQELGCFGESNEHVKSSFLWNIDAHQSKDDIVQSESYPSILMKENNHVVFNLPDGDDGSLTSVRIKPSGFAEVVSEHGQEDQGVISSEPNSHARDGIHSSTDENGCIITFYSDVVNTSRKEFAGIDTTDCPPSLASFEHKNSKPGNEICETQDNSHCLVNSLLVIDGCPEGSLAETPVSEAEVQQNKSCVPCRNGELLDLVYPTDNTKTEQSGLANSSGPDLDICGESFANCMW